MVSILLGDGSSPVYNSHAAVPLGVAAARALVAPGTRKLRYEGRQQQVLLGPEVARDFALEEVEEGCACLDRSLPPGALELERREQSLVVLVR